MQTVIVLRQCYTCGAVKVHGEWRHSEKCRVITPHIVRDDVRYAASHGLCDECLPAAMGTVQEFLASQRAAAVV